MLSKFVILALTSARLGTFVFKQETGDNRIQSAGKTKIAWSCKRNECRSAGAMIISRVITECFEYFNNKFELSSFGAEEGEGIEYGLGATRNLVQAFQKNYEEYLKLAIEKLGYTPSAAEQKCFEEKMKDFSGDFTSTAPSAEQICKEHMTVYAANSGVVELIEKKTKEKCEKNQKPQKIDVMKEDGIADGPWHANAMFERLALVKLLEAYPGHYEKRTPPFSTDTGILDGAQLDIYQKRSDRKPPAGTDTIKYPGDVNNILKPTHIGFLWHDLTIFEGATTTPSNIAPEFKTMLENEEFQEAVGWELSGANMKDGMYRQMVIVRPPFFNRDGLKEWLHNNDNPNLADQIQAYEDAISFRAYDELVKTLLPAVIEKLHTNLDSRSHDVMIRVH